MTISAVTAADVASVTVTVTAPDLSTPIVDQLTLVGGTWQGTITQIPVGANRTFTGEARDVNNTVIFSGQAHGITITSGGTAIVMLLLRETMPPDPFDNSAPYITSFWLSSDHAAPSEDVVLGADATDPDNDPLTWSWSANGGSFADPAAAQTTWHAAATDGAYTVTAMVADPDAATDSVSATITVETPTGPPTGSADINVTINLHPRIANVSSSLGRIQALGAATTLAVNVTDLDGDAMTYAWTSTCTGTWGNATTTSPTFQLTDSAPTSCAFTATVTDARGAASTGTIHVAVGAPPTANRAPKILTYSQSSLTADDSAQVTLDVTAQDPDGDGQSFYWVSTSGSLGYSATANGSTATWTAPSCFITPATITAHVTSVGWDTTRTFTISPTHATCGLTFNGSMTITNAQDAAQLVGVDHVTGDIYIQAPALTSLDFSTLQQLDGSLYLYYFGGTTLDMPALTHAGNLYFWNYWYGYPQLDTVNLPSLTTVGDWQTSGRTVVAPMLTTAGSLYLDNLTGDLELSALSSATHVRFGGNGTNHVTLPVFQGCGGIEAQSVHLSAPQLTTCSGRIYASNSSLLELPALTTANELYLESFQDTTLSLPSLVSLSSLTISNTQLTAFPSMPQLTSLGSLSLYSNPNTFTVSLPQVTSLQNLRLNSDHSILDLPNLTSINSFELYYSSATIALPPSVHTVATLNVQGNPSLTAIGGTNLIVTDSLYVISNQALASLSLPGITSANYIQIYSNNSLTSVDLPNLTSLQQLYLQSNPILSSVNVPQLTAITNQLYVGYNPQLSQCWVYALASAAHPPNLTNNSNGPCP